MTIYDAYKTMSTGTLPVAGAVVLSGGPVTIEKAALAYGPVWVKNTSGSPQNLNADAADTVDGVGTLLLPDGASVMLKSDGTSAWVSF